jgi:Family of unknown function (DUF5335)
MKNKTNQDHLLPPQNWSQFFDQLSSNTWKKHISAEIIDPKIGNKKLIHNAPLVAIVYDHLAKGGDLIIKVGREDMPHTYTIDSTTAILVRQNFNSEIIKILVDNAAGKQTSINIQKSLLRKSHASFSNLVTIM